MLVFLGVLMCMGVSVLSAEPPVSPWQALNPALAEATHFEVTNIQEEYDDAPYETTYSEAQYSNETDYEYTTEEELFANRLPFKMDKKQISVAIKLLKAAVKPVLKSKRVRDAVAYIDESLTSYKTDLETQLYISLLLDSMQEIYEGKETSELNMLLKRFFTDMSDEETGRTLNSVWRAYVAPYLTSYVYNPVRNYVVTPVRSYIYDPLSNYVTDFAERIGTWMESSQRPYIDIQYPETYSRWSDTVSSYTNRISDWTAQARQGLEIARRMLELQEESKQCGYNCGGVAVAQDDQNVQYSSAVQ